MDKKKLLLLVAALLVAVGTAFAARSLFMGASTPQAEAKVEPKGPKVLVALRALPTGTIITADSINFQEWPEELVKDAYFIDGEADRTKLLGTVVRFPVTAGQPVTQGALVAPGDRGFLAAALGPGMRAVTIPVSAKTGVGGFVFPGDRVDLVLTQTVMPHMVVGFMIKRRSNAFTVKFPDAIELLVRGLRSGLPVTETLGVVATEVPGLVGEEFKLITDRIKVGRTMEDALQETADRLNMPEFNFFVITLAIQRETGGNLAETLANLADVLRKRSQMKLKIKAMSSESKASAYIVGSLPFIVFTMIWWINPEYLGGFFTDDRLIVTGLGGLTWMGISAFIMAKMVSFEI